MEDRMLSDEILLGLINKNSGGGGGTTNYNDLSNQPQIGGVTLTGNMSASDLGLATETALADKADKSAIKNEFLGTLDEWNALTAEQRKAYDTYQIKGDYTEGSGGLPDYSTTEQKTGQKWIDGKDIYAITVSLDNAISMNQGAWGVTPLSAANIDTIISIVAKTGKFVFSSIGGAIDDGYVNLMNNSGNSLSVDNFTIWYTKSTT